MAPQPRRSWPGGDGAAVRHAAGLVLLFPVHEAGHIVLTLRSDTVARHSGQVSLPGGVAEPGETFEQAALREAQEEVALMPESVRILGRLTPLDIPVSGFRLHPILAATASTPHLRPSDGEVARILEVPLALFFDPSSRVSTNRIRDGQEIVVPAFRIADVDIWGATAMVLAEFLALLGWLP